MAIGKAEGTQLAEKGPVHYLPVVIIGACICGVHPSGHLHGDDFGNGLGSLCRAKQASARAP